ncbi:unnamed protein product [Mytilus edulis]|uniref:Uncharacterized protein n=1 Tax=Mytilus edulis TaxID=6550 RepID=A0A8S3RPM9_MYTED|nr:unnamed protein product [Mytilus edulis]
MACCYGHTDIVKLLLDKNPNVDLCDKYGCSPLYRASEEGQLDLVVLLLEKNPNIDLCDNDGYSPLYMAIKLLLEKNPNVDLCNKNGWSPLNTASDKGHTDIVKLLLEKDPNVDLCDKDGFTPLISSCTNNHINIIQLLIKHKPDANAQTYDRGNALFFNAKDGNLEITQILLETNADCIICTYYKQTVTETVNNNPSETLDEYKQSLFDNLVQDTSSLATDYVSTESVDYAFDLEAGSSQLHIFCFMGRFDVEKCLVDHNADINVKKEDATTLIHHACEV